MEITPWQLEVTKTLAALVSTVDSLVKQVEKQNGNVARIWGEIDGVKEEIGAAKVKSAENEASRAATAKVAGWTWENMARPILYVLIGALVALILANANLFQHAAGK